MTDKSFTAYSQHEERNDRAQELRSRVDVMLQAMNGAASRFGLPNAPEGTETARTRMLDDQYTILVMGEAKRGKSTFLNALIGQDLLPTDVDIATNQVFHVQWAEHPGYRLRYEDETTLSIQATELTQHGSEAEDAVSTDELVTMPVRRPPLRWIEVEGPFTFIPPNIRFLDSPGLGSLHAEHGRITRRFVPQSDAVIFVLSSAAPMGKFERDAVQEILRHTRHIFFIQTQIDAFGEDHWRSVLERNREILEESFSGKIGVAEEPIRVWAVSAQELLLANRAPIRYRDRHFAASRFEELWRGFRRFLFQATGCERIAQALEMGTQFYLQGQRSQAEQMNTLREAGSERRVELQEARKKALDHFNSEWRPTGEKRTRLEAEVRRITESRRQQFLEPLLPGARLERYYRERIERIGSLTEAKELADHISTRLPEYVAAHWLRCAETFRAELIQMLLPALGETQTWDVKELQGELPTLQSALRFEREVVQVKDSPLNRFATAWRGVGMALGLGALISVVPGAGIIGLVLGPAIASGVAVKNVMESDQYFSEQTRPHLRNHLTNVLTLIRDAYTHEEAEGGSGLVSKYLGETERGVLERVQVMVNRRRTEMEMRLREMDAVIEGSQKALEQKMQTLKQRQQQWSEFAAQLAQAQHDLTELYRQTDSVSVPRRTTATELTPEQMSEPTVEVPVSSVGLVTPEKMYRDFLRKLKAKSEITEADYEKLDELKDRLNLPYAVVKRIEREEDF
ncbi:MAG: hypothetical protein OHK0029_21590 [Armatimonadaceae bacterium]